MGSAQRWRMNFALLGLAVAITLSVSSSGVGAPVAHADTLDLSGPVTSATAAPAAAEECKTVSVFTGVNWFGVPQYKQGPQVTIKDGTATPTTVATRDPVKFTITAQNRGSDPATVALKVIINTLGGATYTLHGDQAINVPSGSFVLGILIWQGTEEGDFTWTVPSALGPYSVDAEVMTSHSRESDRLSCAGTKKVNVASFEVVTNTAPTATKESPDDFSVDVNQGDSKTFRVSGTDAESNLNTWRWLVAGSEERLQAVTPTDESEDSFSYKFDDSGNHIVTVVSRDTKNRQSFGVSWQVDVSKATPTIDSLGCKESTVSLSETVTCRPSISDGNSTSYEWEVDGGVTRNSGDRNLSVYWTSTGAKTVSLTASNNSGKSEPETFRVRVVNEEPSVSRISISPSPSAGNLFKSGTNYSFSATGTDDDGNLSACQWYIGTTPQDSRQCDSFGSWTGSKTAAMTFNEDSPGSYTVRVVFRDSGGESDDVSRTITVNSPPEVTLVSPTDRSLSIYEGQELNFTVRAEDADGNLMRWKVDKVGSLDITSIVEEESVGEPRNTTKLFDHLFDSDGTWDIRPAFTDALSERIFDSWTVTVREGLDFGLEDLQLLEGNPPLTVNSTGWLNAKLRNHSITSSRDYQIRVFFRKAKWELGKVFWEPVRFNSQSDIVAESNLIYDRELGKPILDANSDRASNITLTVPEEVEAGPTWLCADINASGAIPDGKERNNSDCILTFVVSDDVVADWVYPFSPSDGLFGRVWFGVPWRLMVPEKMADELGSPNQVNRINSYHRVISELARREAIKMNGNPDLKVIRLGEDEVGEDLALIKDTSFLLGKIFEIYDVTEKVSGAHTGIWSFASAVTSGVEFGTTLGDTYMAMVVNRQINLANAIHTLEILEQLALDEDYHLPQYDEWQKALDLAGRDIDDMTSEKVWNEALAAFRENSGEIVGTGTTFIVSVAVAGGLKVVGISVSAAVAAKLAPFMLLIPTAIAFDEQQDHIIDAGTAAQVYAELYEPDTSEDHREALAYAKYAAYSHLLEAHTGWFSSLGLSLQHLVKPGLAEDTEDFLEIITSDRDIAFAEAKSAVQLSSIEFPPQTYAVQVGDTVELAPRFLSGSGRTMLLTEIEWFSDQPGVATVANDGTVTGVAPGATTITLRAEGISGTADVVVTADPIADTCSNGIAVNDPGNNPGLVDDCEALLQMRDSLAGTKTLDWSTSRSISSWQGLSFHADVRRVAGVKLDDLGLDGTLPSTISGPTQIMFIQLSGNELTGSIPAALGSLSQLLILDLSENRLSGSIPVNLTFANWSSLEELKLNNNGLTGTIPTGIRYLSALRILDLSHNGLRGAIPRYLSELDSLLTLNLRDNTLSSPIPGQLGELPVLQILDVRNNDLTGRLSDNLDGLGSHLREIYLSGNSRLSGCVTDWLWQVPVNDYATSGLEQCSDLPVPVAVTWASGILSLSSTTLDTAGGDVIASVVTVDGDQQASAPTFTITGPVDGGPGSKTGVTCTSSPTPVLNVGERCWEASFTLPANADATVRSHNVTVRSRQISSVPVGQVTVAAAETATTTTTTTTTTTEDTTTEEPGLTSTVSTTVIAAFAPLGVNLQWVLHFDNETQEWLYYNAGAPPTGTLDQLAPGQVYWLGLDEDQTVALGGVTHVLKAGVNQVVW